MTEFNACICYTVLYFGMQDECFPGPVVWSCIPMLVI